MENYSKTTCAGCGSMVAIVEEPMGVPGGQEREQAYCPKCGTLVAKFMTDGFIRAYLIDENGKPIYR